MFAAQGACPPKLTALTSPIYNRIKPKTNTLFGLGFFFYRWLICGVRLQLTFGNGIISKHVKSMHVLLWLGRQEQLIRNTRRLWRLVAFAPFQGARLSAPEPAAMSLTNFRYIATMPTSGKKHPQWVLLVHSSGIEPESAAPEATVLSVILRVLDLRCQTIIADFF